MQYTDKDGITHDLVDYTRLQANKVHPKSMYPWVHSKRFEKPGNFVEVEERTGMLKWAEPQDAWIARAPTGQQMEIITKFRLDDTPHCQDLFLYSNVTKNSPKKKVAFDDGFSKRKPAPVQTIDDIMEENRIYLNRSRKWYVRQFLEQPDKAGVRRFATLPVQTFLRLWRQPVDPRGLYVKSSSSSSGIFNLTISGGIDDNWMSGIAMSLRWKELAADAEGTAGQRARGVVPCIQNERTLPWLRNHCSKFYLFSDYQSMFIRGSEEFCYIADLA